MHTAKPYNQCTPDEIARRTSPHLIQVLDNRAAGRVAWTAVHGRDQAALTDRTLVGADGTVTDMGRRVLSVIKITRAAAMEAKYQ
ncbi:MAG: hypothetical protein L0K27_02665 [Corynebacterium nuruki]|jgi:hypothetical protein|nr:hypothetical protein [Corynebacterium nuruki]